MASRDNSTTAVGFYPIGLAGRPWGEQERVQWRARQSRRRSYEQDVVQRVRALSNRFEKVAYGQLEYESDVYTVYALRSRCMEASLPTALITGGVHGYETSGVSGALEFLERHAEAYSGKINFLVVPCVSPWAYERINRWNYNAVDPNRNFRVGGPALECTALMDLVYSVSGRYLLHIDLHETTDSDESEFRPALSARDGKDFEPGQIPHGFYLVADEENVQLDFQRAIISAVEKVANIASPDAKGGIIGSPVITRGVIAYPLAELALCASITGAPFTTTTEVYPDAADITPDACIRAQVEAVGAALDFALGAGAEDYLP
jgi:hypothetical protein